MNEILETYCSTCAREVFGVRGDEGRTSESSRCLGRCRPGGAHLSCVQRAHRG